MTSFYGTSLSKYCNGKWYFFSSNNSGNISTHGAGGIAAIKLGTAVKSNGEPTNYSGLFCVSPMKPSDALLEIGKTYNMVIFHANTDSKYWGTIVK